jgi:hypothetical protein
LVGTATADYIGTAKMSGRKQFHGEQADGHSGMMTADAIVDSRG